MLVCNTLNPRVYLQGINTKKGVPLLQEGPIHIEKNQSYCYGFPYLFGEYLVRHALSLIESIIISLMVEGCIMVFYY